MNCDQNRNVVVKLNHGKGKRKHLINVKRKEEKKKKNKIQWKLSLHLLKSYQKEKRAMRK